MTKSDLQRIPGIGPSLAEDLQDLGFERVDELVDEDPEELFEDLSRLRGVRQDRCVLYVFRCAVHFAENPECDDELRKWWNWKDGGSAMRRRT